MFAVAAKLFSAASNDIASVVWLSNSKRLSHLAQAVLVFERAGPREPLLDLFMMYLHPMFVLTSESLHTECGRKVVEHAGFVSGDAGRCGRVPGCMLGNAGRACPIGVFRGTQGRPWMWPGMGRVGVTDASWMRSRKDTQQDSSVGKGVARA